MLPHLSVVFPDVLRCDDGMGHAHGRVGEPFGEGPERRGYDGNKVKIESCVAPVCRPDTDRSRTSRIGLRSVSFQGLEADDYSFRRTCC